MFDPPLFQTEGLIEAAGGGSDVTSKAVVRLKSELTALLTAPLTNREYQIDRDHLAVPADIATLRQQRAAIFADYQPNQTFGGLMDALRARIKLEPQFAEVLQAYLMTRNINLPSSSVKNSLSSLPGVGLFDIATVADAQNLLNTLPGTITNANGTSNQYLPASFFAPLGSAGAPVLTRSQGDQVASSITDNYFTVPNPDLTDGAPPARPTLTLFDPGPLPPPPLPGPPNPGDPTPPPPTPPGSYWEYDHVGPDLTTTFANYNGARAKTGLTYVWAPPASTPLASYGYGSFDGGRNISFYVDRFADTGTKDRFGNEIYTPLGRTTLSSLPSQLPPPAT